MAEPIDATGSTAALTITLARPALRMALSRLRIICQPETSQRHPCEANAEFLEGTASCDGLNP
jgi:hypothetical protein